MHVHAVVDSIQAMLMTCQCYRYLVIQEVVLIDPDDSKLDMILSHPKQASQ